MRTLLLLSVASIALAACREETARDPLVAEHVAWAIEKLGA